MLRGACARCSRVVILWLAVYAFVLSGVVPVDLLSTDPLSAQITPLDDEPDVDAPGLGNIVGSPEAGPDPEDAGDRGGWAQLTLAGVIVAGVAFIASRIVRESRRVRSGNISHDERL